MKYATLPGSIRIIAGLFLLSLLFMYAQAQWNLWLNVGQGDLPTISHILEHYHGKRGKTRLESVLDPDRDPKGELAMY